MNRNIINVFRKELLDTLRDRKTLIFMLLVPTLVTPALMVGMSRVMQAIVKKRAVQEVTLAADAATQQRYVQVAHKWFVEANKDPLFGAMFIPALNLMLSQTDRNLAIPPSAYTDANAYRDWLKDLGKGLTEAISREDLVSQLRKLPDAGSPPQGAGQQFQLPGRERAIGLIADFYMVGLRGLAFVEFVEPASISPAPAEFQPVNVPQSLLDKPNGRDLAFAIKERKIHGYLELPQDPLTAAQNERETMEPILYYDSTISLSDEAQSRVDRLFSRTGDLIVRSRLASRNLGDAFLKPYALQEGTNLATRSQIALNIIGGFVPYLVIVFVFLGGLYPAIDLGAGEKERNTLETLLLSPITRTEIAIGKFSVIFLTSLVAALLGVVSIAASFRFITPDFILQQFQIKISPSTALFVALLTLPPAAAISGIFLALSIFARSFKEAQNYIAPLQFVIILPAVAGMIPGLEMNWKLAMIPLVNVSMLAKDLMKGETNWGYYGLTMGSCALLAIICIALCVIQFRREEVLFRS